MDDTGDWQPTAEEITLAARLEQRGGISVPVEVIHTWSENERKWAEMWADNLYLSRGYRISSALQPPRCLKRFLGN